MWQDSFTETKRVKTWKRQKKLPEVFYKKRCSSNFAEFTGKHLYQRLFFNKVGGLDSGTGGFLWILRNLSEYLFYRTRLDPLIGTFLLIFCVRFCCVLIGFQKVTKFWIQCKWRHTCDCKKHFLTAFLYIFCSFYGGKPPIKLNFSRTYEVAKFSMIQLCIDLSDVMHANEHEKYANCGLHVNFWNFC